MDRINPLRSSGEDVYSFASSSLRRGPVEISLRRQDDAFVRSSFGAAEQLSNDVAQIGCARRKFLYYLESMISRAGQRRRLHFPLSQL